MTNFTLNNLWILHQRVFLQKSIVYRLLKMAFIYSIRIQFEDLPSYPVTSILIQVSEVISQVSHYQEKSIQEIE